MVKCLTFETQKREGKEEEGKEEKREDLNEVMPFFKKVFLVL